MTTTWIHPFERSGLGKAPFRCTEVTENWWVSGCGTVRKPGGTCQYCGTGILFEFHIQGADGSRFKVGSDCVHRTGQEAPHKAIGEIEGFRTQRLKLARMKRAATQQTKAQQRKAERETRESKWAAERETRYTEFKIAEPQVCAALNALIYEDAVTFFEKMADSLKCFGGLTAGQLAAVKSIMARETEKAMSEFVAEPGKRIEGSFEIITTRSWENTYVWPPRTVFWTLMKMNGRDIVSYKGNHIGDKGEKFRAKFTVKEHETYQNTKQTKLQRPHIFENVPA